MLLTNKMLCTGCSACASICKNNCISMIADENGFRYPQIDTTSCVACNLCQNVCPILHKPDISSAEIVAYAVYSKDETLRLDSSSGGVFSELAQEVLRQNGAVYGAAYNDQFEVYHCCAETVEDLAKLRGAKYSQSVLGNVFLEVQKRLKQEQMVLFSGTPCQVAGLKSYLQIDYENLICVDFVCHGVPSPMAWNEYVKNRAILDNEGEFPYRINLRSKETGWSRYQYSNVFEYTTEKKYSSKNGDNLFMKLFVGDYINRTSCSDCQFKGYERVSDFIIGDFWGIWDIAPEMDDDKGTSVVLIHSEKGRKLLSRLEDRLVMKTVTLEEASRQNPCMVRPSPEKSNRDEVLGIIRDGQIMKLEALFQTNKNEKLSFLQRAKLKIRRRLISMK